MTGLHYHLSTVYDPFNMKPHYLDWGNQPRLYKDYSREHQIQLYQEKKHDQIHIRDILAKYNQKKNNHLALSQLAQVLLFANGITKQAKYNDGIHNYRSAASAGALYPNEIYVIVNNHDSLASGIYYFYIPDMSLIPIQFGSYHIPPHLPRPDKKQTCFFFMITGIFFRSTWKYRDRGFRYILLDAGHILANLGLTLRGLGFAPRLAYDFDDDKIAEKIGVDHHQEAVLATYTLNLQTESEPITEFKNVKTTMAENLGLKVVKFNPISGIRSSDEDISFNQAVINRRSKRNFIPESLESDDFQFLLSFIANSTDVIFSESPTCSYLSVGVLAQNIAGFSNGFYLIDLSSSQFGLVHNRNLIPEMAQLCLGQKWLANANLHFLFLSNLGLVEKNYGIRGYRYVMQAAGILGQSLYLGATAKGFGCCGIGAFFDEPITKLLALEASSFLLYLVAVGRVRR